MNNNNNNNNKTKFIKFFIYLIPILICLWLLNKYFVFTGNLDSSYVFDNQPSIFNELQPETRVHSPEINLKTGEKYQRIQSELVYFSLNIPRSFQKANFTFTFDAPSQPIINVGIKRAYEDTSYEFKTLKNDYFDKLNKYWTKTYDKNNKIVLMQNLNKENENYDTVQGFINNPPQNKKIGTYYIDLTDNKKLENYKPSNKINNIETPLRGKHEIYTYIKDETLDYNFSYYDLNNEEGLDQFNINVYKGLKLVYSNLSEDDGNNKANNLVSEFKQFQLKIPDLAEGKYLIKLALPEDIIINKITTRQKYTVFASRIRTVGNRLEFNNDYSFSEVPVKIFSPNSNFQLRTFGPVSEQEILIDNQSITLSSNNSSLINHSTGKENNELIEINAPLGNILLLAPIFVFNKEQYFDPYFNINQIALNTAISDEFDYIIGTIDDYLTPQKYRNWYKNEISFETANAYTENGELKFAIQIPGFNNIDDVIIKDIKVNLQTDNIFKRLFNKINIY